jgi:hypothetical protein
LAFDELGPSQMDAQKYAVNATGVVSRTLGLWKRHLVQYIIIVGIFGASTTLISFIILFTLFGTIGTLGTDPVSYIVSNLFFTSLPDSNLIVISLLFACVVFIINAILGGAAIKYALDDYGARGGDIRASLSHSYGKILNFIAVQLVISLISAIVFYPGLLLLSNAMGSIDISDPYNPIIPPGAVEMILEGFVILLVGSLITIYFSARLAPTTAIVIDTDLSAIDSLKKSWAITSGNVLHVIGSWFIFGMAFAVLGFLVEGLVFLPLYTMYLFGYISSAFDSFYPVIGGVFTALLFWTLNYIFSVVLYRDLSSRVKESSLDELMI